MLFSTTTTKILNPVKWCRNCNDTLKNKKYYMAYPRNYRKRNKEGNIQVWFGIAKRCKRCGHLTEADIGG